MGRVESPVPVTILYHKRVSVRTIIVQHNLTIPKFLANIG